MKSTFFVIFCLFLSQLCWSQRQRVSPKYYAARLGVNLIHLSNYKTDEKQFYSGGNILMELPFSKKWTVGFGFSKAIFKDNQKPYFNSVAIWNESLQSMFTEFKYYPKSRYDGFFIGATEGLMLKKIDALVPLEYDVTNRQTRIPFNERLNSFTLGLNTGYVLPIKKHFLLTFDAKVLALRNEWSYQFGLNCGFKFL